jgi:hypothetical protein
MGRENLLNAGETIFIYLGSYPLRPNLGTLNGTHNLFRLSLIILSY